MLVTVKPGHAYPPETQLRTYYSKVDPVSSCRFQIHLCIPAYLTCIKFASYSFSLSFKFARFNFATLLRLIRASNLLCSFFLVCLIELLTINVFIMSVFYQQILQYLSKLNQKAIRWPSKNAFKIM